MPLSSSIAPNEHSIAVVLVSLLPCHLTSSCSLHDECQLLTTSRYENFANITASVDQLDDQVKLCYICREEERYDGKPCARRRLTHTHTHTIHHSPAPGTPPRAWTHPCTCTLIAHESCLLRWIQSSQSTRSRASNALKCPQCGTAYELTSSNPWLLRWLDMGNKGLSMIGRVVSVGSLTVVVVSLGTGAWPSPIP